MTRRRTAGLSGLAAGLLVAAAAVAQEPKADPKAEPTARPSPVVPATFRAFLVTDGRFPPKVSPPTKAEDRDPRDRTRKMHDLVGENGLSPVVAVFVRTAPKDVGEGLTKLVRAVDKKVPEYRADKLAGYVLFLRVEGGPKPPVTVTEEDKSTKMVELDSEFPDDEKRDEYVAEVEAVAKAANAPNVPFGLAPANGKAAAAWGVKAEDEVTVVIYSRMRVRNRWAFPAAGPNDEQVAAIIKETEAMIADIGK
jgi:hypothetical protein